MKDYALFQGEIIAKLDNIDNITKIISTKLAKKYLWVYGIQVCSNEIKGHVIFQGNMLASLNQPACIHIAVFKHINLLV